MSRNARIIFLYKFGSEHCGEKRTGQLIIINPLILNRVGRFLLVIVISHDYDHCAPLRQSRSTRKYDESRIKSTLDVRSQLTKHPVQSYECDFSRVAGCVLAERRQCQHRRRWAATFGEKRLWGWSEILFWI